MDITYKNGTLFELNFRNAYPTDDELVVNCENSPNFMQTCGTTFELRKNFVKSNKNEWFGTITIVKKLNFLEQSFYQLIAVAKVNCIEFDFFTSVT